MYKTLEDIERVLSLGKKETVIDTFIASYLQGEEFKAWEEAMKSEHETLYPKQLPNPEYVEPLPTRIVNPNYIEDGKEPYWISNPDYVEPVEQFIDNVDYINFEEWMAETQEVQVGTKDIYDEDGITVVSFESVMEDRLIRVYEDRPIDIIAWKESDPIYKTHIKNIKNNTLGTLTVTTRQGNVFDANETARVNMLSAISASERLGVMETLWRMADNSQVLVALSELQEAHDLAILAVGNIVVEGTV